MTVEPTGEQAMARLFDSIAPDYDMSGVAFFQPIALGLIEALTPLPSETFLDIGCGRGAVLLPGARAVHPGEAVGIDISPAMVNACRTMAAEAELSNVRVLVGDAMDPELPAGAFDVVASSLVLFFLPSPDLALRSWRGLLRPGGRMGVTTFGPSSSQWQHVDEVLAPFLPRQDARSAGAQGPFASDAGMEALLAAAGLTDIRTVTQHLDVRFVNSDQWYRFSMTVGQRAAWLAMDDDQRSAARVETTRRIEELAESDGSVTFSQEIRHSLGRRPSE